MKHKVEAHSMSHTEKVNFLKFQNEQLQKTLAFKECLDNTLASKDKVLVQAQAEMKQLKTAKKLLRIYAKQKIKEKDALINKHQQQIQELQTDTYKLKRMIL